MFCFRNEMEKAEAFWRELTMSDQSDRADHSGVLALSQSLPPSTAAAERVDDGEGRLTLPSDMSAVMHANSNWHNAMLKGYAHVPEGFERAQHWLRRLRSLGILPSAGAMNALLFQAHARRGEHPGLLDELLEQFRREAPKDSRGHTSVLVRWLVFRGKLLEAEAMVEEGRDVHGMAFGGDLYASLLAALDAIRSPLASNYRQMAEHDELVLYSLQTEHRLRTQQGSREEEVGVASEDGGEAEAS